MNGLLKTVPGCAIALLAVCGAAAQSYKTVATYKLPGGAARGIAVDSDSRRVYVAEGDGVTVLNADTGAVSGTVTGLSGADDVLLIPAMTGETKSASTKGYASDESGRVIAFSLADGKTVATVKLGVSGATSLCYDADTATVEAVSATGELTSIDAGTDKVLKSGKLPTGSGQVVCGNMTHVYVADTAANVVHVLNHETMRNDGDYPMKTGKGPTGLALDTKGRRLFVSCEDGTIEVVDTDAGFTFIELKGGRGESRETFVWLPQGKGQWRAAAFVAQADGTLSGVRMNAFINYSIGGEYKLSPGLRSVAYDEKTHRLYMTATDAGSPAVVVAGY